jgi:hypothetical protein
MKRMFMGKLNRPKGMDASRLRQKKFARLRSLHIPEDALPGSLSLTYRRCGKSYCHCAEGEGHPVWRLTFMVDGKKRIETIPPEWVEEVQGRVEMGRAFKAGFQEVMTANAELLVLEKKERGRKKKKRR